MSTEIYSFSGGGNSLHVARDLQWRLPDAGLVPMVRCLEQDIIAPEADAVGLVFPIHDLTLPIPVRRFISKLDPAGAEYLFAIATRGATAHRASEEIDRILKRKHLHLGASFTLTMPSNDPEFRDWRPPTPDEPARVDADLAVRLDAVAEGVCDLRTSREPDIDCPVPVNRILMRLIPLAVRYAELEGTRNSFYANARCTGCGTCSKVCPSGKVRMTGGRPEWRKDITCYLCYACINYCQRRASQIKSKIWMRSYTEENERYPHPFATIDEIAAQR